MILLSDLERASFFFFLYFFRAFSAAMDYLRYSMTMTFLAAWNCLCAVKPCMAVNNRFEAGLPPLFLRWLRLREIGADLQDERREERERLDFPDFWERQRKPWEVASGDLSVVLEADRVLRLRWAKMFR